MGSSWVKAGPKTKTSPFEKREENMEEGCVKTHMKMEAETGAIWPWRHPRLEEVRK